MPFGQNGKQDATGSYGGITYSTDGKYLLFSQDSSNVTLANVSPSGLLTNYAQVSVPPNNTFIKCFPNSPNGPYGRHVARSIRRAHRIPAALRSQRTARAPTPC